MSTMITRGYGPRAGLIATRGYGGLPSEVCGTLLITPSIDAVGVEQSIPVVGVTQNIDALLVSQSIDVVGVEPSKQEITITPKICD